MWHFALELLMETCMDDDGTASKEATESDASEDSDSYKGKLA